MQACLPEAVPGATVLRRCEAVNLHAALHDICLSTACQVSSDQVIALNNKVQHHSQFLELPWLYCAQHDHNIGSLSRGRAITG